MLLRDAAAAAAAAAAVNTKRRRVRGDAYYQLLDEFLTAVKRRYGNTTLIHFNDMAYDNAAKLLNMYRTDFPCFSDELQVRLLLVHNMPVM